MLITIIFITTCRLYISILLISPGDYIRFTVGSRKKKTYTRFTDSNDISTGYRSSSNLYYIF